MEEGICTQGERKEVMATKRGLSGRMRLGGGGRFAKLKGQLESKGASNPGALAAWIGRKKYGKSKFQGWAAAGRKRAK